MSTQTTQTIEKKEVKFQKPEDIRGELQKITNNERSIVAALGAMRYKDTEGIGTEVEKDVFTLDNQDFQLSSSAMEQVCARTGVPARFWYKCSRKVREALSKQFFESDLRESQIILADKTILGVLPKETPYVSMVKAFDVVNSVVADTGKVDMEHFATEKNHVYISWLTQTQDAPPKRVGEVTRAGLCAKLSRVNDFGHYGVEVGGYLFTLACLNGAITRKDVMIRARGQDSNEVLGNLKIAAKNLLDKVVQGDLQQFVHSDEQALEDPAGLIHRAASQLGLSAQHVDTAINRLPQLGQRPSYYQVINLVTSLGHEATSMSKRWRVWSAGGNMITFNGHRCPSCSHYLN